MKKLFTLIVAAFMAVSVNAQTETVLYVKKLSPLGWLN